jgi:membrane protease YdiL (CAAX protease family)
LNRSIVDHIFFALLLALPLIEWKWSWPRYLGHLAAHPGTARLAFYRRLIVGESIPTLILLVFWAMRHRPWSDLYTTGAPPFRLVVGFVCVFALIALLWLHRRALLARPDRGPELRKALASLEPLIPHTRSERKLFWLVSATAGACEEIFFRGFLSWYLSAWMGPVWAVIAASALFGLGHLYMGIRQVPKTALVGLIFALIVALAGSIFPAMLFHAAIDWNSGELGFRLFRPDPEPALSADL